MMSRILLLGFFLCFATLANATQMNAKEIVDRRDNLMRGKSSVGIYEMYVESPRWKRTVKFKAWSLGTDKSFIRIDYPQKDKGSTFLRIETDMWQYVPRIEKTIKIPPSMMLQSWMGSDFTNDDLAKESSIINDYSHRLLSDEKVYMIESTAKADAAVVWGKIIQTIDKENFIPIEDHFFDEDGELIRKISYSDARIIGHNYYPMVWKVESLSPDKLGHLTTISIKEIELDLTIADDVFTMRALKKYQR